MGDLMQEDEKATITKRDAGLKRALTKPHKPQVKKAIKKNSKPKGAEK
jgi:hypothetical protein